MKPLVLSVLLVGLWTTSVGCQEFNNDAKQLSDSQKLDAIFRHLSRIERKQDDLATNFANLKQEACGCSPQTESERTNRTRNNHDDTQSEYNSDGDDAPIRPVRQISSISTSNEQLFYLNKLASSENLIPSSSSDWNEAAAENSSKHNLAIDRHYESSFRVALENLSTLLKDQLASFRFSLNKLMSRLVDHSYQYQFIVNKLTIIRDECSLAASLSLADRVAESNHAESLRDKEQKQAEMTNTTRSSDIALIVRLLSSELSHLLNTQQPQLSQATPTHAADLVSIVNETNSLMFDRVSGLLVNETRGLVKRLDEIGSVSKQSAMILGKLWQSPLGSSTGSVGSDRIAVLDVPSSSAESASATKDAGTRQTTQASSSKQQALRWFPGSRVPGKQASEQPDANLSPVGRAGGRQPLAAAAGQTKRRCLSKTSSIRPASCQELRQAGANCTGQYYVFVRGNIKHVYCDMNMDSQDEGGGWTVVLRRIDKSLGSFMPIEDDEQTIGRQSNPLMEAFKASQLDFRLDWSNYRAGFGQLNDWAEFFAGLDMLHQLAAPAEKNGETSELQIDLEFSGGERQHLRFENFSIGGEKVQFELRVSGCNASDPVVCRPIALLDGSRFFARDNSSQANPDPFAKQLLAIGSGWWIPSGSSAPDHWLPLTMPIVGGGGSARHLYWPGLAQEPLKRITMKVRTRRPSSS